MAEVLAERKTREATRRVLEQFFLSVPLVQFGVFPDTRGLEATASPEDTISVLCQARQHMSTMMGQVMSDIESYLEVEELRTRVKLALTLLSADVKFKAKELGLDSADWSVLEYQLEEAEQALVYQRERLTPTMAAAWSRLDACLTLLRCRERHPVLKNLDRNTERYGRLVSTLALLGGIWPKLRVLRRLVEQLSLLFQEANVNRDKRAFQVSVSTLAELAYNTIIEVLQPLAEAEYPYKHLEGPVSIAQYAAPEVTELTANAILETGIDVVERIATLYIRIWGELVWAAEQVEKALDLPPLPGILNAVHHGERSESN